MDNTGREELLLEVIRDFTSITYPEYADEDNIKKKIYEYILLLKKFKENRDDFTYDKIAKLNKLHQFFYGVSFDPENPNSNIYKTPIFDKFNSTYQKIDKLINETNNLNADLLKSLLNIISVYYEPSKNKDVIINEYLDNVIIPLVNKYKGIGVVADSSLKEEKVEKNKKSLKSNIGKSDENSVGIGAEPAKAAAEPAKAAVEPAKAAAEPAKAAAEPAKAAAATATKKDATTTTTATKKDATTATKDANVGKEGKEGKDSNDILNKSEIIKLLKTDANDNITKSNDNITTSNDDITTSNGNFKINDFDYDKLKEYLQALYLQLEIDSSKIEFINEIIKKINELNIIVLEDFNNNDKNKYIKIIQEIIIKHLNNKGFNINDFIEKNNDDILKILSLFKVNKKGNYLTSYNVYSNNLKLLNKLFYYPNPKEINEDFYKNKLKFLINKLTENNDDILYIIENIRLLINLIIEHDKKIYGINFLIQINKCKINDLPDTYKKILILLNLLLKNDDFNSNVNILKGGGGYDDKILSEKKINDINLNLLFTLIKDKKDNKDYDDIIKIYKLIITDDKNKEEDIKNIIEKIVKTHTIDLKKTIIIEFNKNINRIFKDNKNKDITEENIINNLCNKTFNLDTIINKEKLRELIKLKELAPGTNLFYYYYNLGTAIKRRKFIDNIEQLLSINDFCTITYNMYPGTEVKFQDIIYIENSKYNLPIIYDDKRNDSYDIIELIFDILKKNDNDYKSKIKKLLLDFNNEFIISDDNIDKLKKLNINEQSFKDNRDDIVKEIKQIKDTKKCLDYMNNTIDFYKTEIAKILSYNLPKFYEEKSITPDVSFDINTILSDTNYVSDNIVKNNFLNLKLKQNKYDDKYYPIQQYITLKNLEYVQKNATLETTYCFCYDEETTYKNKKDFIEEIIKRIRIDNLNLEDYINIKYTFLNNNLTFIKKYKCKIRDILTLNSNLSFNYFKSSDEPIYNFDRYLSSSSTYNFYKYLYLYFLNEKINNIKYSSTIYNHCKEKIKEFIEEKIKNLELKKPIELEFFENIEEAKENLKDKLENILKKNIEIDNNKSYEEIILDQLNINNDLLKHIDIKNFKSSLITTSEQVEQTNFFLKKLEKKEEYHYKFSIYYYNKEFIFKKNTNDDINYTLSDFIKLKDDKLINIKNLLIKIVNEKLEKTIAKQKETDKMLEKSLKGYNDDIKIKLILNFYNLKINVEKLRVEVKEKALEVYDLLNKFHNFKSKKNEKLIINKDIEEEEEENEILGGSNEKESYNTYIYKYIDKSLQTYLKKILETNNISGDEPISLNIFKQLEAQKEKFIEKNKPKIKLGSYEYVINEHYNNLLKKTDNLNKNLSIKKIDKEDKNNKIQDKKIRGFIISSKKFNLELNSNIINVIENENGLFNGINFIKLKTDNINFYDLLKEIINDPSYKKDINKEKANKDKENDKKANKDKEKDKKANFDKEKDKKANFDKDEKKIFKLFNLKKLKQFNKDIIFHLNNDIIKIVIEVYDLIKKYFKSFSDNKIKYNDIDEEEEEFFGGIGSIENSNINESYDTIMYKILVNSLINYLEKIFSNKEMIKPPKSFTFFKKLEENKLVLVEKVKKLIGTSILFTNFKVDDKYSYEKNLINILKYIKNYDDKFEAKNIIIVKKNTYYTSYNTNSSTNIKAKNEDVLQFIITNINNLNDSNEFYINNIETYHNTLIDFIQFKEDNFDMNFFNRKFIDENTIDDQEKEDENVETKHIKVDNKLIIRRSKGKVILEEEEYLGEGKYVEDDKEEEEEENYGGFKNIIELEDVFKLYYNSDESINNIYKLYFIINIYGFYYQDDKEKYGLIENILEIIKIDIFNDDIIETIKNLITTIYHKTREIYEYYIRYFDKIDKIIKNYCKTRELINKYLNMNFIYEFYKNYQKKDIKIDVNINGTILNIDKSLTDIKTEIDELFINGECLFPQSSYQISINPYDNEIDNFIHFIYDFTKNQSTFSLTNLNDLNAFIVLQLLSNENDMINLVINGDTYMIKNINNHPYKLYIIENFNIQIRLNDVQMGLYKQLFEMNNRRSLLGILAKEYYYLDFNIQKRSKFKFHLNYEIIPFISLSKIDDDFKRTIINYNSFKPMMIDEIKDLSILSLEKNSLIFLINYGILLASTIFSQINIKNFISLIHIYLNIKNNTKRYLNLYNYNGDNQTLIIYRDYIKSINYISFIESVLYLMRNKINLKIDLKNFIKSVINFKENHFIIPVIKIDEKFLQSLYNIKSYEIDKKIIEDFYLSFLLIYKNCLKGKVNNNIIKMFHIFIIPNLRFFHNKIDIRDIENEVLDIKAIEYIRLIRGIRGGDGEVVNKPENQLNEINIEKAKKELKENDNVILTTELTDNTKNILKLLQVFNDFYIEFNKLDLNKLLNNFENVINELFLITENQEKSYYIISDNKLDIFDDLLYYKEDKLKYEKMIRSIRNKVTDNLRNLEEVIKNFSYFLFKDKEKAGNLNDKTKNLAKILDYIETIENSLIDEINGIKKFKDKSVEVNNVFLEFFPLDETQVPLMDNIKEFIIYYKKKFDKFLSLMSEAKVKYDNFKESLLDHDKKAQAYFAEEERTELNAISEKIQELKSKKNEIISNKNKLNAEQEKINEKIGKIISKIDVEETNEKPNTKLISIYKNDIEALKKDIEKNILEIKKLEEKYVEFEKEINTLRSSKKVGGNKQPLKETDNNIKDLLNKKDIPFKDKDENVSFEDRKNEIKKRFDNIKKDYRKLKVSTYIPNSVNKDMILEKFINKKGDTLFEQILNNYQKDVKEKNLDIAKANFYESVENNNLDPIKELEITFIDKLIFAFLIIFLRYAGLYMTYRFIDNKFVKSIKEAIIYYSLSYVAVLFAFLVIVNIDLFRLRIIFNYCNLHINSSGILSHMIIKIIIGYVIYLLIINLDNEPVPTYLSKNQIIKLKKKIDILSMIVIVFLLIFVLII